MKVRPVSEEQLPQLFALYDEYDRPKDEHPSLEAAITVLSDIRSQKGEIFVATNPEILGTYMIHVCHNLTRSARPYAVIENVICRASHRRSGVGKVLMDHAIVYAKRCGCYKIFLQTGESRTENHSFYEACGFEGGKRAFQIRLG